MPLLPGADPFTFERGPIGVLLCHGFTGTPQSLRAWGEHLAAAGVTVSCPRLPGHGTRWQDLNLTRWEDWYGEVERSFGDLRASCAEIFVMGLSMGGTLALRLAEQRPDGLSGLVLVNPSVLRRDPRLVLLPVLRWVVPSFPGIASDIKRTGVREVAYDRVPLHAFASLTALWRLVRADLDRVSVPVLLFRSAEDHVVEPANADLLLSRLPGPVQERVLSDSYHVATLDNDAETIFEDSVEFIRQFATSQTEDLP